MSYTIYNYITYKYIYILYSIKYKREMSFGIYLNLLSVMKF